MDPSPSPPSSLITRKKSSPVPSSSPPLAPAPALSQQASTLASSRSSEWTPGGEARHKARPLNPARFFSSVPETDLADSKQQTWWCPETDTPTAGLPTYEHNVGSTPLVDLSGLLPEAKQRFVRLVGKVEFHSAGGSASDRVAKHILDEAEATGKLQRGMIVLCTFEGYEGEGAVSLAVMSAIRGFACVVIVGSHAEAKNQDAFVKLEAFGARLVESENAEEEATRLWGQRPGLFFYPTPEQVARLARDAFHTTLGPEIWSQTNGEVSHFVSSVQAECDGVARFLASDLNAYGKPIRTFTGGGQGPLFVDVIQPSLPSTAPGSDSESSSSSPQQSPIATTATQAGCNPCQWIGTVSDTDALRATYRLCREEGILAGPKSGLNIALCLQLAETLSAPPLPPPPPATTPMGLERTQSSSNGGTVVSLEPLVIVTTLPDHGIAFLSTLYNAEFLAQHDLNPADMVPVVPPPGCLDLNCPGCSRGRVCPRAPPEPAPTPAPPTSTTASVTTTPKKTTSTITTTPHHHGGGGVHRYLTANPPSRFRKFEDLIGNTPIVDLSHLINPAQCKYPERIQVLAKCEFMNPGFSLKDRIARNILNRAEESGALRPGMAVIAASSGNTGAAVAMLCAMRGYACVIVTCPKCSKEKRDAITAYGATLLVTAAGLPESDENHYMNVARRLCKQNPGAFFDIDQYDTASNPEGHYRTLGPEVYEQSQCEITHFVAAGSTGGTVSGVAKYLKEVKPDVQIVLADPVGSVFTNYFTSGNVGKPGKYLVEGVGKGSIPGAMNFDLVDAVMPVADSDAFEMCVRLCREEGICAGGSSGLNVFAALRLGETLDQCHADDPSKQLCVVTVMPDSGFKYLTKVYNSEWLRQNSLTPIPPPMVQGLSPSTSSLLAHRFPVVVDRELGDVEQSKMVRLVVG